MKELVVEFIGICTHFRRSTRISKLPAPHRVVLVDSEDPPEIQQGPVLPHLPALFLLALGRDPQPIFEGLLTGGFTMAVAAGGALVKGPVSYESSYIDCLPLLTTYYPGYVPDLSVVVDGGAACYLDVHAGILSLFSFREGERHIRLRVPIPDGEPVSIVGVSADGSPHEHIVPDGHSVALMMRTDPPGQDAVADFLLQYLTAEGGISSSITEWPGSSGLNMPECILPIGAAPPEQQFRGIITTEDATTAACSNSGYP